MVLSETANKLFELLDEVTTKNNKVVDAIKILNGNTNNYLGKEMVMIEELIVYELGGTSDHCELDDMIELFFQYQHHEVSREVLIHNVLELISS